MECGDGDKRDVRRPMNAFLIFCKRHRSIVREKNPDLDNRSVTRILGDLWANLKDDEKSMYTDLAKQYKDAFMKANPDYKWHNPEKTVAPQKPTMPKPTNMKLLKNDMDLFSEGSIMPGKLADPSNMGGLSLLLIAGQQSDNQNVSSDSVNLDKTPDTHNTDTKTENLNTDPTERVTDLMVAKETANGQEGHMLNEYTEIKSKQQVVQQIDGSKSGSENDKTQSLLDLAEMCSNQLGDKIPDTNKFFKNPPNNLTEENVLDRTQHTGVGNTYNDKNCLDINAKQTDEKENISRLSLDDANKTKDLDDEESAMVTCGKLVVNHIIDKLYSSEIATAARKMSKPMKGPLTEKFAESIKTEENDVDNDNKAVNLEQVEHSKDVIRKNSISMEFDEPDGWKEKEAGSHTESVKCEMVSDSVKQEANVHKTVDGVEHCENGRSFQDGMGSNGSSEVSVGGRKHLLSETGSTEGEDVEESQPIRKSRRRNRGQRYQELINEGIIQPSKERMAALQHPSPKDEIVEEDFQSIDSYILPETAIRRIRKRTTSESAKDKMYHHEDVKRYKTGDFDLEAHIATLPACPIESMGRKRGFVRSRHSSECSHIRKPAEESQVVPMFVDTEKTVFLPPHVRLPSPQRTTEPVVGSRKRKARKHSITHLIPVPPVIRKNSTSSVTTPHTVLDPHKTDDIKIPVTACDAINDSKSDVSDMSSKTDTGSDSHADRDADIGDKINPVTVQEIPTNCDADDDDDVDLPKNENGCDMKFEDLEKDKNENEEGDGAIVKLNEKSEQADGKLNGKCEQEMAENVSEKYKQETNAEFVGGESKLVSSKTENQNVVVVADDDDVKCSGMIDAENNDESVENIHKTVNETTKLVPDKQPSHETETYVMGKSLEWNSKSLQEVDSNIPRTTGSDVISQNEAVETAKPKLQDSLEKLGTNAEKTETDLNFNSTVTS